MRLVINTDYELGKSPRELFPLSYSLQQPSGSDLNWVYADNKLTARVLFAVVAGEKEADQAGPAKSKPTLLISVSYELIGFASKKPSVDTVAEFVKNESARAAYPLFRARVMELTVEAGFPALILQPTLRAARDAS